MIFNPYNFFIFRNNISYKISIIRYSFNYIFENFALCLSFLSKNCTQTVIFCSCETKKQSTIAISRDILKVISGTLMIPWLKYWFSALILIFSCKYCIFLYFLWFKLKNFHTTWCIKNTIKNINNSVTRILISLFRTHAIVLKIKTMKYLRFLKFY